MIIKKELLLLGAVTLVAGLFCAVWATKLADISAVDKDYLMIHFQDGEVTFRDNGIGPAAFTSQHQDNNDTVKTYGNPLNTANAVAPANWLVKSEDDANYGTGGKTPANCYRKSKVNGMAEKQWVSSDYLNIATLEHWIYLRLPSSLSQGKSYSVEINPNTNTDSSTRSFTFDIYQNRSEAVHVNLVGYATDPAIKAADLYLWMGDGGSRDYAGFVGNTVHIFNVSNSQSQSVGTISLWKTNATEAAGHNLIRSNVWNADFSAFSQTGTFRLAVDGVGCSQDFEIRDDAYYNPFKVSVKGYFYMRMSQDSTGGIRPVPRRPLYIPGRNPANTIVYLTTMQPYNAGYSSLASGDAWDSPAAWAPYRVTGNPTNPNAWGGHADALDWDRHLGHVSDIYDMLLPFFLTHGAISDDNLGIAESGNAIPDILDEARYEVDFWLRLRDGAGYSHGITNPTGSNVFYQAGPTAIAAWANAANCAMLADCFRIAGLTALKNEYRDSAVVAYNYAGGLSDQMLDKNQNVGDAALRGRDFKMMAAVFLYNVTGDASYETVINTESLCANGIAALSDQSTKCQLWATAGYLLTPQTVHYPTLYSNMKASILADAKQKEANFCNSRPSRRASDDLAGYYQTTQNVHRTMIAHAVADNQADKTLFRKALVLEADWGLGRNPLNIIQMTTASTDLASKRSLTAIYTSGRDDGTPGMHPGHTPYLNMDDWSCSMVMGCPSWLYSKGYPSDFGVWPFAEGYFPSRYVYAHSEFTPKQTMRGKMALYGYLYGIGSPWTGSSIQYGSRHTNGQLKNIELTINGRTIMLPGKGEYRIRMMDLSGRTVWSAVRRIESPEVLRDALPGATGLRILQVEGRGTSVGNRLLVPGR